MPTVKSLIKDYGTVVLYFGAVTVLAIFLASCSAPRYASGEHFRVDACPTWAKR